MKKTIISSLLAVAALAPVASFAADGNINFIGAITTQTCTINNGNGNLTVNLPRISASAFANNAKPGATPFTLNLTNCTTGAKVRAFFEFGSTVDPVTGFLKVATGGAQNVQIGLANPDGTDINVAAAAGSQNANQVTVSSSGSATLSYMARYVAVGGTPTAGAATSNVAYSLEYQ